MSTNNLLINNSIVEDEKDIKIGLMQNINGIFVIGRALSRIKEGKKYKTELDYNTFEEYLEQRIGFSRMTGYRYVEIADKLSENVSARLQNFSIRKLYLIASAVENEQQAIEFIEEKHIINNEEKTVDDMTTRELEQAVKEKKELKKRLDDEQEYSNKLQKSIQEKEQEIKDLQDKIDKIPVPKKEIIEKEVVKEVIPEKVIQEKALLKQQIEKQKQQLVEIQKRAEKAENTLKGIRLENNLAKDEVYDNAKLDTLIYNINDFLNKNSKYTYLKEDLQHIPSKKRKFVEEKVNSIKEWVMLMEQALDNRQDVVGNMIYGEGEIIK